MIGEGSLLKFLIGVAAVLAAYYFLSYTGGVLAPFLLAIVAGYLINPLIASLEARGYRRDRLVLVLYLSVISFVVLAAGFLVPWTVETVTAQKSKLPEYLALARTLPALLEREAARLPFGSETLIDAIRGVSSLVQRRSQEAPGMLLGLLPPSSCISCLSTGRGSSRALFASAPAATWRRHSA